MEQIDLYLITGFLGAGKTTVLKEILQSEPEHKIGVIMNEFGKVGIDGGLVDDRAAALIEINRGSIFCDCLKLSFIESLKDMSEKPIHTLFVEGSGLADPSNIVDILDAAESLIGNKYNYKGSICVVDAPHFLEQSKDIESMHRQIKFSHLAVVSKSDLVDEGMLESVKQRIYEFNSDIKIVFSEMGRLPFNIFKEDLLQGRTVLSDSTTNKKENKPKTLTLEIYEDVDKEQLISFLNEISKDTYRMKGYVRLKGLGLMQVDVVNNRIDFKECPYEKEAQIVMISKIGVGIIRSIVSTWEEKTDAKYKLKN